MNKSIALIIFLAFLIPTIIPKKFRRHMIGSKSHPKKVMSPAKNIKFVEKKVKVQAKEKEASTEQAKKAEAQSTEKETKAESTEKLEETSTEKTSVEAQATTEVSAQSKVKARMKAAVEYFSGKYKIGDEGTLNGGAMDGIMRICCQQYMKICGYTLNFQPDESKEKIDIFQGFVFRYKCTPITGAKEGEEYLSCVMIRGKDKYHMNIYQNNEVYIDKFVSDYNYAPFQCHGRLIKIENAPKEGQKKLK